ncbi:hypothetical protein Hanom_Chr17g01585301 [Helianthus anomalus]
MHRRGRDVKQVWCGGGGSGVYVFEKEMGISCYVVERNREVGSVWQWVLCEVVNKEVMVFYRG